MTWPWGPLKDRMPWLAASLVPVWQESYPVPVCSGGSERRRG